MASIPKTQPATAATAAIVTIAALLGACGSDAQRPDCALLTTRILGEPGTQTAQFSYPRGMDIFTIDNKAFAAVVDKTARIQIFDLDTGAVVGAVRTPRWDRGKPTGLTVAPSPLDPGTLAVYVADTHEFRVLVYNLPLPRTDNPRPTEPDFQFGSFGTEPGQFIYPTDIAVETDAQGRVSDIFVSEYGGNDRISHFTLDHNATPPKLRWMNQIGIPSQEIDASDHPVALARPQSIELWTNPETNQREIVLTDASHHRIGRLSTRGDPIAWFGDPLRTDGEQSFNFPYGLTILRDNTALVAEFGANRVSRVDLRSGRVLERYGTTGRGPGQLAQPWAVGAADQRILILDSGNNRIQFCTPASPIAPERDDAIAKKRGTP